jgi:hypothetical protein
MLARSPGNGKTETPPEKQSSSASIKQIARRIHRDSGKDLIAENIPSPAHNKRLTSEWRHAIASNRPFFALIAPA